MYWKTKLLRALNLTKDFGIFLTHRARNDTIFRVAASLSYTSLIAIVPLFAIGLSIFQAFPAFENIRGQVQELIISNLAPAIGTEVNIYLNDFLKASAGLTTYSDAFHHRKQPELHLPGFQTPAPHHQNNPLLDGHYARAAFARRGTFSPQLRIRPFRTQLRRQRPQHFSQHIVARCHNHAVADYCLCSCPQQKSRHFKCCRGKPDSRYPVWNSASGFWRCDSHLGHLSDLIRRFGHYPDFSRLDVSVLVRCYFWRSCDRRTRRLSAAQPSGTEEKSDYSQPAET